ncbi:JAB domain-containing protein [Algibacter sp. L4_22]|uniref:JAB domain-containing protein n=1 Tax=Algibacter sp. L4_22 TaxID=2942477 RepID=UPI00201B633D|nr:JAB domain-containing protein [Algibacter sp. L4_22]MCL5127140.1 hypothetical protein [Algibacter sp. L4_22]
MKIENNKTRINSVHDALLFYKKHNKFEKKFSLLILDLNNNVIEIKELNNRYFNSECFNVKYLISLVLNLEGCSLYIFEYFNDNELFSIKKREHTLAKIINLGNSFNIKVFDYLVIFKI